MEGTLGCHLSQRHASADKPPLEQHLQSAVGDECTAGKSNRKHNKSRRRRPVGTSEGNGGHQHEEDRRAGDRDLAWRDLHGTSLKLDGGVHLDRGGDLRHFCGIRTRKVQLLQAP
ncbi:MAG: hypothetical protein ACODUE_06990 [Synechococcus sp.]